MLASVLPGPFEMPPMTQGGSQWDALFWGFVASVSLLVSAVVGSRLKPGTKTVAGLLAFTAGVLIALLSYDLIGEAFAVGGLAPSFLGMGIGLLAYVSANRWLARLAFVLLRESGPFVQAALIATAGGGILAMTLQTVIPESFDGTDDLISVLGAIGFAVVFTLSHVVAIR